MGELVYSDTAKDMMDVYFIYEDEKHIQGTPKSFKGKKLETIYLPEKNIFVVGLGKKEELKIDYFRRGAATAVKTASTYKISGIHFSINNLTKENCTALLEGAMLANYFFDKYKSKDDKFFKIEKFSFPKKANAYSKELNNAILVCKNVYLTRDLVSDSSDVITPDLLEKLSRRITLKSKAKLKMKVLHEKELKKQGLDLLYGVGKAGTSKPRLIMLEYNGNKGSKDKIMFVGKGITFDSGGLNIKICNHMLEMRTDMAGAATVLSIIKSAVELKMKKNIVVLMPCAENLVDSTSQRPGDIIKSYSGKTVENMNTDAEGRLVLADAIAYGVKKYNPKLVVEYSTLTGAIVAALGSHCAGMVSTSKEYQDKMFEAGLSTYERVWPMPLFEEYLEEVKGERADFRSLNKTRKNGAIFGGAFLSKFCEGKPFIHIDVAGTAMLEDPKDYMPKAGSGFGVRLAISFLENL
ncbi:MAG: leucyl aminopeptidase [Candidatus Diapherotrites archaeon]